MKQKLLLEYAIDSFGQDIPITVIPIGHGRRDLVRAQALLIELRAVLHASISVVDQRRPGASVFNGLNKSPCALLCTHAMA